MVGALETNGVLDSRFEEPSNELQFDIDDRADERVSKLSQHRSRESGIFRVSGPISDCLRAERNSADHVDRTMKIHRQSAEET